MAIITTFNMVAPIAGMKKWTPGIENAHAERRQADQQQVGEHDPEQLQHEPRVIIENRERERGENSEARSGEAGRGGGQE